MAWIWFGRCWWWQKGLALAKCPPLTSVLVLKQKRDLILLMAVSLHLGFVLFVFQRCILKSKHVTTYYISCFSYVKFRWLRKRLIFLKIGADPNTLKCWPGSWTWVRRVFWGFRLQREILSLIASCTFCIINLF